MAWWKPSGREPIDRAVADLRGRPACPWPRETEPRHTHPGDEFIYLLEGKGTVLVDPGIVDV